MGKQKPTPIKEHVIIGVVPGPIFFKGSTFDLSELTPSDVDYLIANECEYIKWKVEENAEPTA